MRNQNLSAHLVKVGPPDAHSTISSTRQQQVALSLIQLPSKCNSCIAAGCRAKGRLLLAVVWHAAAAAAAERCTCKQQTVEQTQQA